MKIDIVNFIQINKHNQLEFDMISHESLEETTKNQNNAKQIEKKCQISIVDEMKCYTINTDTD